jgi:hypothetical protein
LGATLAWGTSAAAFQKEEHVVQVMREQKHIAEHKQANDDERHPKNPDSPGFSGKISTY